MASPKTMKGKGSIESELRDRFEHNVKNFEASFMTFRPAFPRSQSWLERELGTSDGNAAQRLLTGAKLAMLDAGAAWAVGSNRGAASALRVFIENSFAWIYYKDHAIEFKAMEDGLVDLVLPKATQTYIKSVDLGYDPAHALLAKSASRSIDYYYSEVSGYVHAHPAQIKEIDIAEMIVSKPPDPGFLNLVSNADEFISDFYATVWRKSWDDIPELVQKNLNNRLDQKLQKFLES